MSKKAEWAPKKPGKAAAVATVHVMPTLEYALFCAISTPYAPLTGHLTTTMHGVPQKLVDTCAFSYILFISTTFNITQNMCLAI